MVGLFSRFVPHTTLFAGNAYSIASQRKAKGHHFFPAHFYFLHLQHNLSILVTAIPTLPHLRAPSKYGTSARALHTFLANPLNHVTMLALSFYTRGNRLIEVKYFVTRQRLEPGFTLKSE